MSQLAALMRAINLINRTIGNLTSWFALGIVLVCFWVVVERYIFSTTQLYLQDLYVWLNGAMFTAAAGYALYQNDHVRVDIFFRPAAVTRKALLDLIGVVIFLLPYCFVVWYYSWRFVLRSWNNFEGSANVGGMPGLFVLKTFILAFAALVALQGVAMAIRSILILARREDLVPDDFRYKYETE